MMLGIYDDRTELVENILPEYPVYSLFHALRDLLNLIDHQNLPDSPT
jgi:hypothetical protein